MRKRVLALFLTLAMALTLTTSALGTSSFPDVNENADYAEAVNFLKDIGVMNGDDKGNFNPNKTVTRAEMATILCNMLGEAEGLTTANVFADVPKSHWANKYIAKAVELGFVSGYGDGMFGPNDNVTFEQAITMIVRALELEELALEYGGYPDGYLKIANEYGLTKKIQAQIGEKMSRGQIAIIVYNTQI